MNDILREQGHWDIKPKEHKTGDHTEAVIWEAFEALRPTQFGQITWLLCDFDWTAQKGWYSDFSYLCYLVPHIRMHLLFRKTVLGLWSYKVTQDGPKFHLWSFQEMDLVLVLRLPASTGHNQGSSQFTLVQSSTSEARIPPGTTPGKSKGNSLGVTPCFSSCLLQFWVHTPGKRWVELEKHHGLGSVVWNLEFYSYSPAARKFQLVGEGNTLC